MRSCSDPEIDSKFVSFEIVNSQIIMKANADEFPMFIDSCQNIPMSLSCPSFLGAPSAMLLVKILKISGWTSSSR